MPDIFCQNFYVGSKLVRKMPPTLPDEVRDIGLKILRGRDQLVAAVAQAVAEDRAGVDSRRCEFLNSFKKG
jgi:hypothetical protein